MNFKFLTMAICLLGLNAQAGVNYPEIGRLIKLGNSKMSDTRAMAVCLLQKYEANQSCDNLEIINNHFTRLKSRDFATVSVYDCANIPGKGAESPDYIAFNTRDIDSLISEAQPNDPVLTVVDKYKKSLVDLQAELDETYAKAKFNETYVGSCLLGIEPTPVTIKALICQ